MSGTQRTLVMACSATKLASPGPLEAFRRYDGPAYRVLRKHCGGQLAQDRQLAEGARLQVYILSAKYGLISSRADIDHYDLQMSPARSRVLIGWSAHAEQFQELLRQEGELFVVAGAAYRSVLDAWACGKSYRYAIGGIGEQLGQLKRWLNASHTSPS